MFLSLCDFFDPPQAIVEVGEVIQFYDSDRRFPAWGFGGRTADGHVSHAFNLNGASYGDEVTYETRTNYIRDGVYYYKIDKKGMPANKLHSRNYIVKVSLSFVFFFPSQVVGVEGIMSAYSSALANVALAGPTLFSHVVDKAAHIASQSLSQNSPKYFVLLIITVSD